MNPIITCPYCNKKIEITEMTMAVDLSSIPKPPKENKPQDWYKGWVYVVGNEELGLYKIGMTMRDVIDDRINEFRPKLPFSTKLFAGIRAPSARKYEAELHKKFKDKRTNGEWFRLSKKDIAWLNGYPEDLG